MTSEAVKLARRFHDLYEQMAPGFGYTTREETRRFIPESPNGKLMIAVCEALAASPEVAKLIAEAVAAERGPEVWLIYKNGRGWYRPNAQGYTNAVAEAGRYTYADAMKHSHPNGPEGPRDGMKIKHIENVLKDEAAAIRRGATL